MGSAKVKKMFCGRCGSFQRPGARFCGSCGAPMPQAQQEPPVAEPASLRCESCGAMMKQVGPRHFVCEYCGSEAFPKPQPVQPQPYQAPAQPLKSPEEDILDSLYAAAKRLLK